MNYFVNRMHVLVFLFFDKKPNLLKKTKRLKILPSMISAIPASTTGEKKAMTILKSWPRQDTKQFEFLNVIIWWTRTN